MKRIMSALAWASVIRILGIVAAFLINVAIARLLPVEEVGQYFIAFSVVMFLAILMRLGIKQTTLRLVSRARNDGDPRLLQQTIVAVLRFGLLSTGVGSLVLSVGVAEWIFSEIFHADGLARISCWVIAWTALLSLSSPIGESLRAMHQHAWGVGLDMSAQSVAMLLFLFALSIFYDSLDLEVVVKIWFFVTLLVNLAGLLKLNNLVGLTSFNTSFSLRDVYSNAWPVAILNISTFFTANSALWVVGALSGHESAALFGVALKFYNILALPLLILNLAIEPYIADYIHNGDKSHLEGLLRLSASLSFLATSILSLILIFGGRLILQMGFGEPYVAAYPVLMFLVLGNVINVLTGSCSSVLILQGKQRLLALINAFVAAASIVLSLALVPSLSGVGGAISTAVAVAIANLVAWWFVLRMYGVNSAMTTTPWRYYRILKEAESSHGNKMAG